MNPEEPITLGPQQGLPQTAISAYLIEARSWGGLSGTPAFVYFTVDRDLFIGDRLLQQVPNPKLLGLVVGHFDINQPVKFKNQTSVGESVPLNAGLSIVVPAQDILDLIQSDEVAEERQVYEQRLAEARTAQNQELMHEGDPEP